MLVQNSFICKRVDPTTRLVTEIPCEFPSLKITGATLDQNVTSFKVMPNGQVPVPADVTQYQVQPLFDPKDNTDSNVVITGDSQTTSSYVVSDKATIQFSSTGVLLKPLLATACNSKIKLPYPTQTSVIVLFENRTGYFASVKFSDTATYAPNAYDCAGSNTIALGPREQYQYVASKTASFVLTVTDTIGVEMSAPAVVPYGNQKTRVIPFLNDIKKSFAVMTVPPMVDFTSGDGSLYPNYIMNIVLNSVETTDYAFQTPFNAPVKAESMPTYQIATIAVLAVIAAAGVAALLYTVLRKRDV